MTREMLAADPFCAVGSVLCTKVAVCLHHITARSVAPERVLDPQNVIRSCHACNMYIETAPGAAWAESVGLKKRSWEKD